jgi:hypothetical protein
MSARFYNLDTTRNKKNYLYGILYVKVSHIQWCKFIQKIEILFALER